MISGAIAVVKERISNAIWYSVNIDVSDGYIPMNRDKHIFGTTIKELRDAIRRT